MTFTPKVWNNFQVGGTPLTAAALIDLETRLSAYSDSVAASGRVGIDIRDYSPGVVGSDISTPLTNAIADANATYGAYIELRGLAPGPWGLAGVTIAKPYVTLKSASHVVLTKSANGAMLTLSGTNSYITLDGLMIAGNGGTYTGAGIVTSGEVGDALIVNSRIYNTLSYCIDFSTAGSASRFQSSNLHLSTYLGADGEANQGQGAIHLPSDTGFSTNRKFINTSVNGYIATVDGGNENSTFIGGVGNNFNFLGRGNKFTIIGMRITPLSILNLSISMLSGVLASCSVAGGVIVLANSADSVFGPISCSSFTFNSGTGDPNFKLPNTVIGLSCNGAVTDNGTNRIFGSGGDATVAESVKLDGAASNYAKAIDSAELSITGDIDLRAKVQTPNWVPSGNMAVINKWDPTNLQGKSYQLGIANNGKLTFFYSSDGSTSIFDFSTVATGFANNQVKWIRATYDADNGAAGRTTTFYTSDDGVSWVTLGAPVITAGAATISDQNAALEIGSQDHGTQSLFTGKIFRAQIYNGIAGTLVADFNPAAVAVRGTRQPALMVDLVQQHWVMQGATWDWSTVELDTGVAKGTATFSGTGAQTAFIISHGLSTTPAFVDVTAQSTDARGDFYVTAVSTTITVTYATAPIFGSSNVVLWWKAEA